MTDPTVDQTTRVIRQFNDAFLRHAPALLDDLVAADCVLEDTGPAPHGARHLGRAACLGVWRPLAADPAVQFTLEDVDVRGDRATIRWHVRRGGDASSAVRGVNLMRVRDGR